MFRVIAERESAHESVALRWDTNHNSLNIVVIDKTDDDQREYQADVPRDKGMDAFIHPFCYVR